MIYLINIDQKSLILVSSGFFQDAEKTLLPTCSLHCRGRIANRFTTNDPGFAGHNDLMTSISMNTLYGG